jgi:hypothetical protein
MEETMRKFNKKLNADITELKVLHAKKDKSEFNKRKAEIMQSHKISKATVYREMKKDNPGSYRRPNYNPPVREVTEKEKELVSGMLFRQIPIARIIPEMERLTGEGYTWDRIDRIRQESEKDAAGRKEHQRKGNMKNGKTAKGNLRVKEIPDEKIPGDGSAPKGEVFEYESPHGEDMKEFMGKVLSIDKMDPRSIVTIHVNGYGIRLGYDAVTDIQRYAANSAAGKGYDMLEVAKINNKHLYFEQIRHFTQGKAHSVKDTIEISKVLNQFESAGRKPGMDFEFLVDTCMRFAKKGTKREDIVFYVSNVQGEYSGLSEEMKPSREESCDAIANWALANR